MKCCRDLTQCVNCSERYVVIAPTVDDDNDLFMCFATYNEARNCVLDCDTIGYTHNTYVLKGRAVLLQPKEKR